MSLNVAAGSVTEMVRKLVKEGLVHHEPYGGISLTANGVQIAEELIRAASFVGNLFGYKIELFIAGCS